MLIKTVVNIRKINSRGIHHQLGPKATTIRTKTSHLRTKVLRNLTLILSITTTAVTEGAIEETTSTLEGEGIIEAVVGISRTCTGMQEVVVGATQETLHLSTHPPSNIHNILLPTRALYNNPRR